MTKTTIFTLLTLCCLTACTDPNYHAENYQSFDSMDELIFEIIESIKNNNEEKMLRLLDNETLLVDLLNSSNSKEAERTKAYLSTKEGQRKMSVEQLSKKQRINAFFTTGLPTQLKINKNSFRMVGFEFQKEIDYAQDSPAKTQSYQIRLDNGDGQAYAYDIEVIFWHDKYHLIEAAGYLNKL